MSPEAGIQWRAKLKAFAIHVGISLVVFAVVIAALIRLWYPEPYFWIDGGLYIMTIAAFVDIGLGPSITLVVFRPRDARMPATLTAIAFAQLVAFGGGIYLLYQYRPLFVAYVGFPRNEFFPVTETMLKGAAPLSWDVTATAGERPAMVYIELPTKPAERQRLLMGGASGETTVFQRTDLYRPAEGAWRDRIFAEGARNERRIEAVHLAKAARVRDYVAAHGGNYESFAFIPLNARYGRGMLVFDRSNGRLITALRM
jgi:hypothetical protein